MRDQHTFKHKPQLFILFVTSQYYANRDEYVSVGQQQPYTFEQYVQQHLAQLKQDFKQDKAAATTQET